MKNLISKITSFIFTNNKIIILIILLFVSVFYNIKTKNELDKFLIKSNIKGTYIMQNQNMHDSEYFVFIKGNFYRYRQFELLDKGTYENIYDNIYILKSDNIDEYIVYSNERFHFYDRKRNNVLIYFKTSNIPEFINIDIEDKV